MNFTIPPAPPPSIASDDESDIGIRREYRRMKARLAELERLYATRFRHQVPTAISEKSPPLGSKCSIHLHVVVSLHSAKVACSDCNEPLDPLQVLREFAREERQFAYALEHLRQEKADLSKEIEALRKQKAALRAQVRKAGGKPVERWQISDEGERPEGDGKNGGME